MAEPVGITGTAAGLVSLGLQLYSEISKYIDAVKGRKRDLDVARRHAETLQKCLAAIDEAMASPNTTAMVSNEAVKDCVIACADELQKLEILVTRLRGPTTPADTLSAKAREKGRQLMYPFRKENIVELEKTLAFTNNVLQTALQALGLRLSAATHDVVFGLQGEIAAMRLSSENNTIKASCMSNAAENMHSTATVPSHLLSETHAQACSTSKMIAQQTEAISQATEISIRVEENTQIIRQQLDQRMERFEELLTQLISSDKTGHVNAQVGQLIARPSDLEILCDGLFDPSSTQETKSDFEHCRKDLENDKFHPICDCMERRTIQRTERLLGPLCLDTETAKTAYHMPNCPFSRLIPLKAKHTRALKVTIPGVKRILRTAIRISLSMSTGTGGSTVWHAISWVATVHSGRSPAFRLIDVAKAAIAAGRNRHTLTQKERQNILESCWKRLFWCFEQKKANPSDVSQDGQTLIGSLIVGHVLQLPHDFNAATFLRSLVTLKVPIDTPLNDNTQHGMIVPFLTYCQWLESVTAKREIFETLKSVDTGDFGHHQPLRTVFEFYINLTAYKLFMDSPEFAELMDFGPLMVGILRQDISLVKSLLERHPFLMSEKNYYGQTPLHIAILAGNVPILEEVLRSSSVELMSESDNNQYCPLDYATIGFHHENCIQQKSSVCIGCNMLDVLLDRQSWITGRCLFLTLNRLHFFTQTSSGAVRNAILRHLRDRRLKLQEVAMKYLSEGQMRDLKLSPHHVLDQNAGEVQRLLEAQSHHIPLDLKMQDEYGSWSGSRKCTLDKTTLYYFICDRKAARSAWELGFTDVGSFPLYQIVLSVIEGTILMHLDGARSAVAYASWLVKHGVNLHLPIPRLPLGENHDLYGMGTSAHFLMAFLGMSQRSENEWERKLFSLGHTLSSSILGDYTLDQCVCGCSSEGCAPLTNFLEAATSYEWEGAKYAFFHKTSDPWRVCQFVLGMIPRKERNGDRYRWIYPQILRYFTFTALDLRHTCCHLRVKWTPFLDDENKREIREEDQDQLSLLEDLVDEFTAECRSNSQLIQYMQETWTKRMRSVLKGLRLKKLTIGARQSAEKAGVRWQSDESSDSETEHADPRIFEKTADDLLNELDDIVPEPEIALPPGLSF